MKKICIIKGDGIGPEVINSAIRVLNYVIEKNNLSIEFNYAKAGFSCYQETGEIVPAETMRLCCACDAILFGAVTTPPKIQGYRSAILTLRKELDLFANVRPAKSYAITHIRKNVDLVIIRENTEGLYSGIETRENQNTPDEKATTLRVITRKGSERILRFAYDYALKNKRKKVTVVHKANILRETCGLFREVWLELKKEYSKFNLQTEEMLVDAMAMRLVKDPENFDVIATTNLFGDILSDEAAGLVGGLGFAPSGNYGKKIALFEPVHGSAPDIAGKNSANPIGAILSAAMMLDYLGFEKEAEKINLAAENAISDECATKDFRGVLSTDKMTDEIIKRFRFFN